MQTENIQIVENASVKLGKFQASKIIVKESWNILKQDKWIMWFPIISSIFTTISIAVLFFIFYYIGNSNLTNSANSSRENIVVYVSLFLYYLIAIFIVNFFRSSVYIAVQARFSGQPLTFKQTLASTKTHVKRIFVWSLISATVGMILQIISDKSKLIGKIVAAIAGAAWNILTYFSLPVLLFTDVSVKDSFKESATLIRKNWGEAIIVNFGVGFVFSIIGFLVFALSVGLIVIFSFYFDFFYVIGIVMVLFIITEIILSIISSTLNSIFKLVIYNYAKNGVITTGFSENVVVASVKSK